MTKTNSGINFELFSVGRRNAVLHAEQQHEQRHDAPATAATAATTAVSATATSRATSRAATTAATAATTAAAAAAARRNKRARDVGAVRARARPDASGQPRGGAARAVEEARDSAGPGADSVALGRHDCGAAAGDCHHLPAAVAAEAQGARVEPRVQRVGVAAVRGVSPRDALVVPQR